MKRSTHEAGQAAFVCSFPDMAFMGIPIFIEIIGSSALVSIHFSVATLPHELQNLDLQV